MRRNHLAGILALSLLTWIFIIYILNRPTGNYIISSDDGYTLIQLETNIKEELKANALLMRNVKNAVNEQIEARRIEEEEKAAAIEETRKEDERRLQGSASDGVIAVLVFACNRPTVTRCLEQLIKYRPSPSQFPIIVSQDCEHESTAQAISAFSSQVFYIKQPDQKEIFVPPKEKKFKGYFKIARHYGWALNQMFNVYNFSTTIIIEDDLDISSDLFSYFLATLPLLKQDSSLWCVSAWNDNGKLELIDTSSPELLHRTDFFPGLGWMITKPLWAELSPKWPLSYWDDWIRQPEQRKGRACIRPEVSRTRTFGKIGVSNGLFFEKHLKYIQLNDKYVAFTKLNLTYLLKPPENEISWKKIAVVSVKECSLATPALKIIGIMDNYDSNFVKTVYESPIVSHQELRSGSIVHEGSVRIAYNTKVAYRSAAKSLGLMDDFRSGVPRTGYRGVVSFFFRRRRVYLAPPARWKGYDPSWS